jgi:hypothetical protein
MKVRGMRLLGALTLLASAFTFQPAAFAQGAAAWSPHPSDGVQMHLAREGDANRLDFDFHGHGGYAIARRVAPLDLPPNYQIVFRIRGEAPPENLELKLIDASGDNVWWLNRRDFVFPRDWTTLTTKKRQIAFAWGPRGGGEIERAAALEIVVTAGSGGRGTVWFTDPVVEPLPPAPTEPVMFHSSLIDFGAPRELGGLIVDPPGNYTIALDGVVQHPAAAGRFVWLPDAVVRTIAITGGAVRGVIVEPPSWAPTANDFWSIVARSSRRGDYPRYLLGEQPYWTVVGADGGHEKALVGEDGNVEPFKGGFSIEPFLVAGGKRITWADATIEQSLAEGDLPIPSLTWRAKGVTMTMTAAVSDSSMLQLRYRVRGGAVLELAVRPFQVNPSTQFLNLTGGVSRIDDALFRRIHPRSKPSRLRGHLRGHTFVFSSAREVEIEIPLRSTSPAKGVGRPAWQPFAAIAAQWREKLHRVAIVIPGAPEIADTIRANLAFTLIERDGPALKPGSRSYDRSWIRDGSLISAVLLRLGHAAEAKAFAEWFAGFQYESGKVPCCVDSRGADPVPENDSHGELIYLVAEVWRITHDLDFARRLWPHVDKAARTIDVLRRANHGAFERLVTESISHEGYSAKPVHSYWDDVFCLKGVEDAAMLAGVLGLTDRSRELEGQAADFRRALRASIDRTIAEHALDTVPASAELGDFDPTSTSIAISPLNLGSLYPQRELRRTYERYFTEIAQPRDGYTPYEMRNIGALIRLGERARPHELIERFLPDRRPPGWKEWAEAVPTIVRKPQFIGDMPHAWVASDFIRSILDAVVYEREDGALVVGAGVPPWWIGRGTLHVGPIPTSRGTIDIRIHGRVVELRGDAKGPIVVGGVTVEALPARVGF